MVFRETTWRLLLGDHLQHTSLNLEGNETVSEYWVSCMRAWQNRPVMFRKDLTSSLIPLSESKYVPIGLGVPAYQYC